MINIKVMFTLFSIVFISQPLLVAQQALAPPIINEPLERLRHLVVIETSDGDLLLKTIREIIEKHDFMIDKFDAREKLIEATKLFRKSPEDSDRVVIWLERDFQDPDKYIKVFLLNGRFLEILGEKSGIYRVEYRPQEEDARIGKLKRAIMDIDISRRD